MTPRADLNSDVAGANEMWVARGVSGRRTVAVVMGGWDEAFTVPH